MSATSSEPTTAKTGKDTVYVVLQKKGGIESGDPISYYPLGEFPGAKAVDLAMDKHRLEEGTFVAVPVRSFREEKMETVVDKHRRRVR